MARGRCAEFAAGELNRRSAYSIFLSPAENFGSLATSFLPFVFRAFGI
jgi:hypothetical protein